MRERDGRETLVKIGGEEQEDLLENRGKIHRGRGWERNGRRETVAKIGGEEQEDRLENRGKINKGRGWKGNGRMMDSGEGWR